MVQLKLEYASAASDPYLKKDVAALERIRHKAARFCLQNYCHCVSVADMIKNLEWDTLEYILIKFPRVL